MLYKADYNLYTCIFLPTCLFWQMVIKHFIVLPTKPRPKTQTAFPLFDLTCVVLPLHMGTMSIANRDIVGTKN